jgi:hypothetical protein
MYSPVPYHVPALGQVTCRSHLCGNSEDSIDVFQIPISRGPDCQVTNGLLNQVVFTVAARKRRPPLTHQAVEVLDTDAGQEKRSSG